MLHYWYICDVWDEWDAHIEPVFGKILPRLSSSTTQQIHNAKCKHNTYIDLQFSLKWIKFFKNLISKTKSNYLLPSATKAMPKTKTLKQIKTKPESNETQISKSLNLKSKSKPISFRPINKEKDIALEKQRERERERERENEPASWVGFLTTEEDDGQRGTPKRERRLSKGRK